MIFGLELERPYAGDRLTIMRKYLEENKIEGWIEDYNILEQYILDRSKFIPKSQEELVNRAIQNFSKKYAENFSAVDVLTIDGFFQIKDSIARVFGDKQTRFEEDAFFALDELNLQIEKGDALTEQQRKTFELNLSIIYDGVRRRREDVRTNGETILRSVLGKKEMEGGVSHRGDAMEAYTLFYTGRIASLDIDTKFFKERPQFEEGKPPNGKKWVTEDLISIGRQYGYYMNNYNAAEVVTSIKDNFGVDVSKAELTQEEIVELANRMINKPTGISMKSLMDMALDKNVLPVPTTGKSIDYTLLQLEIFIRLMAEVKLSRMTRKIAETHVYGDLQKVGREKLIELGFNPVTYQQLFMDKVQDQLGNYMSSGDIHIRTAGESRTYRQNLTQLDEAAKEVSREIIDTYGIAPGFGGEAVKYVSPEGETYLITKDLQDLIEKTIDDVAPSGVVRDRGPTLDDLYEGEQFRKRMQRKLVIAERIKEDMAEELSENPKFPSLDLVKATKIVEQYLMETHPEFIETQKAIEAIGKRGIGLKDPPSPKDVIKTLAPSLERQQLQQLELLEGAELYEVRGVGGPKEGQINPEIVAILDRSEIAVVLHQQKQVDSSPALQTEIDVKFENKENMTGRAIKVIMDNLIGSVQSAKGAKAQAKAGGGLVASGAWKAVKAFNLLKKQSVTVGFFIFPNPAYYINNALGAIAQAYIAGGITGISTLGESIGRNPAVYFDTVRYLHKGSLIGLNRGHPSGGYSKGGIMVTQDGRIYTAQSLANAATKHDFRQNAPGPFRKLMKIMSGNDALSMMWMELAQSTDNSFRVAKFLEEIHKGNSEAVAAKLTRDAFYDYASLSEFEKVILRELFLFYAYMRKNQIQVMRAIYLTG